MDCVQRSNPAWKAARSRRTSSVNALFSDGSVRFVADSIEAATWAALGSRAGGEVIGAF